MKKLTLSLFFLITSYWANGQGKLLPPFSMRSEIVDARNISIWLPEGYPQPGVKYSVLYMHDGQNLFDTTTAFGKVEWRVDETLSELMSKGLIKPCIVVGIWNTPKRFLEYAPQKPFENMEESAQQALRNAPHYGGEPLSDAYLRFIVTELKPYIDNNFEVNPYPEATFIAGSSMGGLISLYALFEYPCVFGGAACMSTHWPLRLSNNSPAFTRAMIQYLKPRISEMKDKLLYFDHGTETLDSMYEVHQQSIDSLFKAEGFLPENYLSKKFEGAKHNESSWAERFSIPATFLLHP